MSASRRTTHQAAAFTMVELLVVLGIILLLASMAAVGLNVARHAARDIASQQFLNNISMALSGYHQDFDDFPPSFDEDLTRDSFGIDADAMSGWTGAEILAQALVGPRADDGVTGPGYTQRGRNYGPYLDVNSEANLVFTADADGEPFDQYAVDEDGSHYTLTGTINPPDGRWALTSRRFAWPVLYYRADRQGATGADTIWSDDGRFNTQDNEAILDAAGFPGDQAAVAAWERMEESERGTFATTLRSSQFLLVEPGRDNIFGTEYDLITPGR